MLVAVHLSLALLDLGPLSLDLRQLRLVLLPDPLLLLFEGRAELGCVFDFLTTWEDLRIHSLDLILEEAFLFLGLQEFM